MINGQGRNEFSLNRRMRKALNEIYAFQKTKCSFQKLEIARKSLPILQKLSFATSRMKIYNGLL